MDLTEKATVIDILKRHHLWARKGFGQNFMIDRQVIDDTTRTAKLHKNDNVLEIGPGLGVLTQELSKNAGKVVAVEKDKEMLGPLLETSGKLENLEIINEDILRVRVTGNDSIFGNQPYKIVANLPFYVSSPIFRKFLEFERRPESMTVVVQKEVAEKICAQAGEMNILAVSVQFYGKPDLIRIIPKTSFFPAPKVDAAILHIETYENPLFDVDAKRFFRIVKAGFGEKRKKLVNSLAGGLQIEKVELEKALEQVCLDKNIRAEDLSLADWNELYLAIETML